MRLLAVLNLLSLVLLLFAGCMLVPLAFSLALADGAHAAHAKALAATAAAGFALWAVAHRAGRELQVRDGFLLVALVWTVLPGSTVSSRKGMRLSAEASGIIFIRMRPIPAPSSWAAIATRDLRSV